MLKRIVMWKLKDEAMGSSKQENAREFKRLLDGLPSVIPGLDVFEVGINENENAAAADIVLISHFKDKAAMEAFLSHPEHQKVVEFIKQVRIDRVFVDYAI